MAYVVLAIPISYVCGFTLELDNLGLWVGPTVAVAFNTIFYNVMIAFIDWKKLITGNKQREEMEK